MTKEDDPTEFIDEVLDDVFGTDHRTWSDDVLERIEVWDRCYPGNVNIDKMVEDAGEEIRRLRAKIEALCGYPFCGCGSGPHCQVLDDEVPGKTARDEMMEAIEKAKAALKDISGRWHDDLCPATWGEECECHVAIATAELAGLDRLGLNKGSVAGYALDPEDDDGE